MTDLARPRPGVLALICAVLLPPLGTFLARGLDKAFWVTVALTLVGWLPGAVFSLVVLLRPEIMPAWISR